MAKKWERMGQGAAAGAALGSVVGPWGTAIGGVVGGIGGLIGGAVEDGNIADDQAAALEGQKADQSRERQAAFNKLMLQEAAARGANPTALRVKQYELGMQDMELNQKKEREQAQQQFDAYNETDPSAFVGIAQAGARIGQGMYNEYGRGQPASAKLPSATVNPADLSKIPQPTYTQSSIQDPSLSPEVQSQFDADNLRPLRRGRREGF